MSSIIVENLCKTFYPQRRIREIFLHPFTRAPRVEALRDVCLQIEESEVFGLVGPNGAGKTTLMKILCTLVLPTSGTAFVQGSELGRDEQNIRRQIGLINGEERSFYWRLTGRQNLEFFAQMRGFSRKESKQRAEEMLAFVGLGKDDRDRMYQQYSTGMKHRLQIARALLHDSRILFMDEPTSGLDPAAAKSLQDFVKHELRDKRGQTIIYATHHLQEAEDVCDRIAVLHEGAVCGVGTLEELAASCGRPDGSLFDAYIALTGAGDFGGDQAADLPGSTPLGD